MAKKNYRPLFMAAGGLGALYLLTRNVRAEGGSSWKTKGFNVHLYEDANNVELSNASFERMMKDIAEIDGKRVITWQTNFYNPTIVRSQMTLAKAKIVQGNLESALASSINMSSSQRFIIQQWLTMIATEIPNLPSGDTTGMGGWLASSATRKKGRSIAGMKSWSKAQSLKLYEERKNSEVRDRTLANMRMGMDINLYQPIDTAEFTSGNPNKDMNSVEDMGSALVNTRHNMKRLL